MFEEDVQRWKRELSAFCHGRGPVGGFESVGMEYLLLDFSMEFVSMFSGHCTLVILVEYFDKLVCVKDFAEALDFVDLAADLEWTAWEEEIQVLPLAMRKR